MPQAFAIPTEHQRTAPAALPVDADFRAAVAVLEACRARDGLHEIRAVVKAIRAEREACAALCDDRASVAVTINVQLAAKNLAQRIRVRGTLLDPNVPAPR